jgi:hypothetical protein
MALAVDTIAVPVQRPVQVPLLVLGQVATVLGFIATLSLLDVGEMLIVAGFLLGIDLAVGDAVIDPILLVIETLIDFVYPRMTGDCGVLGQRSTRCDDRACDHTKNGHT